MRRIQRALKICRAFNTDRWAVTALEYGLIAGLIVATIAIGFNSLANALSAQFVAVGASL